MRICSYKICTGEGETLSHLQIVNAEFNVVVLFSVTVGQNNSMRYAYTSASRKCVSA